MKFDGIALGLLETRSIAAGVRIADEVLKTADVKLVAAAPVSPGKFLVIFTGGVAEVSASLEAGRAQAAGFDVDELFLPRVHDQVAPAIGRRRPEASLGEAIAVVETLTVSSTLIGADTAVKAARVTLIEIGTGVGIGGKGFFTLTGDVASVEAAVAAARLPVEARGFHLHSEVLAGPHPILAEHVRRGLLGSLPEEDS